MVNVLETNIENANFCKALSQSKRFLYDNSYNISIWNTVAVTCEQSNNRNAAALTFVTETKIKFSARVSGIPVNILSFL